MEEEIEKIINKAIKELNDENDSITVYPVYGIKIIKTENEFINQKK